MNEFLKLNKGKVRFALLTYTMVFLAISLITIALGFSHDVFPNSLLLLEITIGAGVLLPILVMAIALLAGYSDSRARQKAFEKHPFNEMEKLGFRKAYRYEKSRWHFTEEILLANLKGFQVICSTSPDSNRTIFFAAILNHRSIEKDEFKSLQSIFQALDIEFDFGKIVKKYNLGKCADLTLAELETDLNQFVDLLKNYHFQPGKWNGR